MVHVQVTTIIMTTVPNSRRRHREFIVPCLEVLKLLLKSYPFETKTGDLLHGRALLHCALLVDVPFEAIRLLFYRNPRVVAYPDWYGVTSFSYAKKKTYHTMNDPVMNSFQMAWI